jgi:hypothetical protein
LSSDPTRPLVRRPRTGVDAALDSVLGPEPRQGGEVDAALDSVLGPAGPRPAAGAGAAAGVTTPGGRPHAVGRRRGFGGTIADLLSLGAFAFPGMQRRGARNLGNTLSDLRTPDAGIFMPEPPPTGPRPSPGEEATARWRADPANRHLRAGGGLAGDASQQYETENEQARRRGDRVRAQAEHDATEPIYHDRDRLHTAVQILSAAARNPEETPERRARAYRLANNLATELELRESRGGFLRQSLDAFLFGELNGESYRLERDAARSGYQVTPEDLADFGILGGPAGGRHRLGTIPGTFSPEGLEEQGASMLGQLPYFIAAGGAARSLGAAAEGVAASESASPLARGLAAAAARALPAHEVSGSAESFLARTGQRIASGAREGFVLGGGLMGTTELNRGASVKEAASSATLGSITGAGLGIGLGVVGGAVGDLGVAALDRALAGIARTGPGEQFLAVNAVSHYLGLRRTARLLAQSRADFDTFINLADAEMQARGVGPHAGTAPRAEPDPHEDAELTPEEEEAARHELHAQLATLLHRAMERDAVAGMQEGRDLDPTARLEDAATTRPTEAADLSRQLDSDLRATEYMAAFEEGGAVAAPEPEARAAVAARLQERLAGLEEEVSVSGHLGREPEPELLADYARTVEALRLAEGDDEASARLAAADAVGRASRAHTPEARLEASAREAELAADRRKVSSVELDRPLAEHTPEELDAHAEAVAREMEATRRGLASPERDARAARLGADLSELRGAAVRARAALTGRTARVAGATALAAFGASDQDEKRRGTLLGAAGLAGMGAFGGEFAPEPGERIVQYAVRIPAPDGTPKVFSGRSWDEAIGNALERGFNPDEGEMGFRTSAKGRFVTQDQARPIADAAGQTPHGHEEGPLHHFEAGAPPAKKSKETAPEPTTGIRAWFRRERENAGRIFWTRTKRAIEDTPPGTSKTFAEWAALIEGHPDLTHNDRAAWAVAANRSDYNPEEVYTREQMLQIHDFIGIVATEKWFGRWGPPGQREPEALERIALDRQGKYGVPDEDIDSQVEAHLTDNLRRAEERLNAAQRAESEALDSFANEGAAHGLSAEALREIVYDAQQNTDTYPTWSEVEPQVRQAVTEHVGETGGAEMFPWDDIEGRAVADNSFRYVEDDDGRTHLIYAEPSTGGLPPREIATDGSVLLRMAREGQQGIELVGSGWSKAEAFADASHRLGRERIIRQKRGDTFPSVLSEWPHHDLGGVDMGAFGVERFRTERRVFRDASGEGPYRVVTADELRKLLAPEHIEDLGELRDFIAWLNDHTHRAPGAEPGELNLGVHPDPLDPARVRYAVMGEDVRYLPDGTEEVSGQTEIASHRDHEEAWRLAARDQEATRNADQERIDSIMEALESEFGTFESRAQDAWEAQDATTIAEYELGDGPEGNAWQQLRRELAQPSADAMVRPPFHESGGSVPPYEGWQYVGYSPDASRSPQPPAGHVPGSYREVVVQLERPLAGQAPYVNRHHYTQQAGTGYIGHFRAELRRKFAVPPEVLAGTDPRGARLREALADYATKQAEQLSTAGGAYTQAYATQLREAVAAYTGGDFPAADSEHLATTYHVGEYQSDYANEMIARPIENPRPKREVQAELAATDAEYQRTTATAKKILTAKKEATVAHEREAAPWYADARAEYRYLPEARRALDSGEARPTTVAKTVGYNDHDEPLTEIVEGYYLPAEGGGGLGEGFIGRALADAIREIPPHLLGDGTYTHMSVRDFALPHASRLPHGRRLADLEARELRVAAVATGVMDRRKTLVAELSGFRPPLRSETRSFDTYGTPKPWQGVDEPGDVIQSILTGRALFDAAMETPEGEGVFFTWSTPAERTAKAQLKARPAHAIYEARPLARTVKPLDRAARQLPPGYQVHASVDGEFFVAAEDQSYYPRTNMHKTGEAAIDEYLSKTGGLNEPLRLGDPTQRLQEGFAAAGIDKLFVRFGFPRPERHVFIDPNGWPSTGVYVPPELAALVRKVGVPFLGIAAMLGATEADAQSTSANPVTGRSWLTTTVGGVAVLGSIALLASRHGGLEHFFGDARFDPHSGALPEPTLRAAMPALDHNPDVEWLAVRPLGRGQLRAAAQRIMEAANEHGTPPRVFSRGGRLYAAVDKGARADLLRALESEPLPGGARMRAAVGSTFAEADAMATAQTSATTTLYANGLDPALMRLSRFPSAAGVAGVALALSGSDDDELRDTALPVMALAALHAIGSHNLVRGGERLGRAAVEQLRETKPGLWLLRQTNPLALLDESTRAAVDEWEATVARGRARAGELAGVSRRLGPQGDRLVSDVLDNEHFEPEDGIDVGPVMEVAAAIAAEYQRVGQMKVEEGVVQPHDLLPDYGGARRYAAHEARAAFGERGRGLGLKRGDSARISQQKRRTLEDDLRDLDARRELAEEELPRVLGNLQQLSADLADVRARRRGSPGNARRDRLTRMETEILTRRRELARLARSHREVLRGYDERHADLLAERDRIRGELGEIREQSYRVQYTVERGYRDAASARLFNGLRRTPGVVHPEFLAAHDEWRAAQDMLSDARTREERTAAREMRDAARERMQEVSRRFALTGDPEWVVLPTSRGLGTLAGMVVQRDVAHAVNGFNNGSSWSRAYSIWKEIKTVWNPGTHVGNFASNIAVAHMNGMYLHELPLWLKRASSDMKAYGEATRALAESGVLDQSLALLAADPREPWKPVSREGLRRLAETSRPETRARLAAEGVRPEEDTAAVRVLRGASAVRRWAMGMYGAEDNLFRVGYYLKRRRAGLSQEAAVQATRVAFGDFRTKSPALNAIRNAPVGAPFILYPAKMLPHFARLVVEHPWRYLSLVALWAGADMYSEGKVGEIADADIAERDRHGYGYFLPGLTQLPFADPDTGGRAALDVSRYTPLSSLTTGAPPGTFASAAFGDNYPQLLSASGPITELVGRFILNTDPYTGDRIIDPGEAAGSVRSKIVSNVLQVAAPPGLGLHRERISRDLANDDNKALVNDLLGLAGLRPRYAREGAGTEDAVFRARESMTAAMRRFRRNIRAAQNATPERRAHILEHLRADMDEINRELGKATGGEVSPQVEQQVNGILSEAARQAGIGDIIDNATPTPAPP